MVVVACIHARGVASMRQVKMLREEYFREMGMGDTERVPFIVGITDARKRAFAYGGSECCAGLEHFGVTGCSAGSGPCGTTFDSQRPSFSSALCFPRRPSGGRAAFSNVVRDIW